MYAWFNNGEFLGFFDEASDECEEFSNTYIQPTEDNDTMVTYISITISSSELALMDLTPRDVIIPVNNRADGLSIIKNNSQEIIAQCLDDLDAIVQEHYKKSPAYNPDHDLKQEDYLEDIFISLEQVYFGEPIMYDDGE